MSAQHVRPIPGVGDEDEIAAFAFNPREPIGAEEYDYPATDPPGTKRYKPEDVIYVPLDPDPDSPGQLIGLSPIASALDDIDIDRRITEFTASILDNGAVLDHALITRQPTNEREARRYERRWKARRGGAGKAGGLIVVDGTEGELKQLGMSIGARDMGLYDLRKQIEARILMAMDVPPIIVGSVVGLENATYSNYGQARLALHEENTDPNLWRVTSAFEGLAQDYPHLRGKHVRVRPDLSRVMALLDWEDKRRRLALAEHAGGLTTDVEARASVDRPPLDGSEPYRLIPLASKRIDMTGADILGAVDAASIGESQGDAPQAFKRDRYVYRLAPLMDAYDEDAVREIVYDAALSLGVPDNELEAIFADVSQAIGDPAVGFDERSAFGKARAMLAAIRNSAAR